MFKQFKCVFDRQILLEHCEILMDEIDGSVEHDVCVGLLIMMWMSLLIMTVEHDIDVDGSVKHDVWMN